MDHRHTEEFARDMERAALRARHLRGEAFDAAFAALVQALRRAARALRRRLAHRIDKPLEA